MAHKTLIGGTAYEIVGGKTLINGTAYSIAKGKTLVNGAAHEISFATPAGIKVLLTTIVSGYEDYAYIEFFDKLGSGLDVRINSAGTVFFGQDESVTTTITNGTEFALPTGTQIKCYARTAGAPANAMITVNGVEERATSDLSYTYTLSGPAEIEVWVTRTMGRACGRISIRDK